jgi:hypothetical protein
MTCIAAAITTITAAATVTAAATATTAIGNEYTQPPTVRAKNRFARDQSLTMHRIQA